MACGGESGRRQGGGEVGMEKEVCAHAGGLGREVETGAGSASKSGAITACSIQT